MLAFSLLTLCLIFFIVFLFSPYFPLILPFILGVRVSLRYFSPHLILRLFLCVCLSSLSFFFTYVVLLFLFILPLNSCRRPVSCLAIFPLLPSICLLFFVFAFFVSFLHLFSLRFFLYVVFVRVPLPLIFSLISCICVCLRAFFSLILPFIFVLACIYFVHLSFPSFLPSSWFVCPALHLVSACVCVLSSPHLYVCFF